MAKHDFFSLNLTMAFLLNEGNTFPEEAFLNQVIPRICHGFFMKYLGFEVVENRVLAIHVKCPPTQSVMLLASNIKSVTTRLIKNKKEPYWLPGYYAGCMADRASFQQYLERCGIVPSVCTHSGVFHADDVLACAILRLHHPYIALRRSRDPEEWEKADYVVDVSQKYDKVRYFDHHQKNDVSLPTHSDGTPMSSAGLVWDHFGMDIIQKMAPELSSTQQVNIFLSLKQGVIFEVDALDNGFTVPLKYGLTSVIAQSNPVSPENRDEAFQEAVETSRKWLENVLLQEIKKQKNASRLEFAFRNATGGVIVLEEWMPWQEAFQQEQEQKKEIFIVYPAEQEEWRIQCLPSDSPFSMRVPLPEAWWGKNNFVVDVDGQKISLVFCHKNGFLCGLKSRDEAECLARALVPGSGSVVSLVQDEE